MEELLGKPNMKKSPKDFATLKIDCKYLVNISQWEEVGLYKFSEGFVRHLLCLRWFHIGKVMEE